MNKKYIIKNDRWAHNREVVKAYQIVENKHGELHTLRCNSCNKFVSKKYFWYIGNCCNHCGNKHAPNEEINNGQ